MNRPTGILCLAACLCVGLRLAPAFAVTPAVLVGPDLEGRPVTVSGLHDGTLTVFDENRTLQTLAPGEYLQLRFMHEAGTTSATSQRHATGHDSVEVAARRLQHLRILANAEVTVMGQADRPIEVMIDVQEVGEGRVEFNGVEVNVQVAQQRGEAIEQILIHRAEKQAIAEQRERRAQAAAQNAQPTQPAGPTTHWLELVDGRRLPGRIGFVPDGQSITWTHALLIQEAAVELEDIAAITFNTRSFTAAPPTVRDRVVFVNGDSLEGFILAIKAEGLEFQPHGADAATVFPLDRIAMMQLANTRKARPATAHVVTLADGSRLFASNLAIESDALAMPGALPGRDDLAQSVPLALVRRIDFASPGVRLLEMTEEPWDLKSGGEVFGRPVAPRSMDGALRLHAPMKVAFALPAGAKRFAATASLDLDDAAGVRQRGAEWADLDLVVLHNGRELARHHLDAAHASVRLNLVIPEGDAGELVLELDQAANGPIMDRLLLSEAVLLVEAGRE